MSKIFNTTNKKIILGVILLVVIIGGSYGAYTLLSTPEATEPTETEPETVTVVDVTGKEVTVTKPVERIVALIGAEFISALGCEDKIVGRVKLTMDEEAILPSSVLDVPVVGDTDYTASLELIVELDPDLIISSQRLPDETRDALEEAGIPVLEESTTYPRRAEYLQNLALILDAEEAANGLLDYEAHYEDLVKERVADLADSEKPTVFFEWYQQWFSSGASGSYTEMINTAGGINIAGNATSDSPTLSPEFVAEANPDMILRMLTFYDGEDLVDYQALYDDFLNRTALTETTAIKKEQIYIIKNTVLVARRPIGLLYLAKWFHPELFADIDPAVIHEEYVQTFFGSELSGVFVYPEDAIEPEPTETEPTETEPTETEPTETEPETVTVVDKTGASVEITVPVERIVNIAPGAVEIICALGHEDKIVGRDEYSTFPSSVIDIPVVAESSFSPNMELIMELDPDLVIADEGLSEENRATLEDAGIPVLIEMLMEPRLTACMSNLGLILDAETKAAELVDFYTYYEGIVTERVGDLAESEKPSVYFEWYMPWYSSEPGDSWNELVTTAGGTDIVSEAPASGPELSAEFVAEQNPDVVIRMLTRLDGEDLEAFQALKTDFLTRTALTDTTAVKEENVFIIKNTLLVLRRPVGLLYMAKWFHPSLFADIDPGAIHEEMIQQFFGEDLEGVYAYPEIATAFDGNDAEVTVNLPVERIVSVNGGLTEILCALGYEDVIVGRDATSTSPPSILDVPVIADNSYAPNVELILDVEPDLLFADSMLPYNTEVYNQLIAAGITIFIADTSDPQPAAHSNTTVIDFSCDLMTKIATLLGDADAATEYVDYVQSYNSLVKERLENLTTADRPTVFLEWYQPYQTFVTPGLDNAGGINIAENQTEYAPNLSPEFVVEQNPDIIIRAISSNEHAEADFIAMRDEIMSRPELSSITAVQTGQVYIYDFAARGGIRCVVGYLCWAKWCQPDLFEDIDPTAINAEISQTFLGTDTTGVYCYP